MQRSLHELLDPSALQAACTDLDGRRSIIDHCLDAQDIGTEHSLALHANVLAYATLLLGLTSSRNAVASHCSFAANFTSPCHSYIHLVLIVHCRLCEPGEVSARLVRATGVREQVHRANAVGTSTVAKLPDNSFCVKRKS